MRYRVRTPDGELDYGSMRDVEVAYTQGLVGPDDEVREEGKEVWRKASTIPTLARARPPSQGLAARPQMLSILAAVVLGACSLMLILGESWTRRALGIVLALAMSTLLTRVTFKAFKRPG